MNYDAQMRAGFAMHHFEVGRLRLCYLHPKTESLTGSSRHEIEMLDLLMQSCRMSTKVRPIKCKRI